METVVDKATRSITTHWLVSGVGCVAIWPMTVPKNRLSRREVAMLALPKGIILDLGEGAQEIAVMAVKFDLGASAFYTMRTGRCIPWMKQVNCTSPSKSNILLAEEKELRRKKVK